jgi:hypothetical protein
MFHMTNDSGLFRKAAELEKDGAYRVAADRYRKGRAEWVPLMVGKTIHQFDHRAASVIEKRTNLHNPFVARDTTENEHQNPAFIPRPQFWVSSSNVVWPEGLDWAIAFRDIARPTDVRTVIAAAVPFAGFGNKLPLLLPDLPEKPPNTRGERFQRWEEEVATRLETYRRFAPLLLANLNSFGLDYVARQKLQGTTLNLYIVEQFPIVPMAAFGVRIGGKTAEALVREEVLRLTYTANDMASFARDQSYEGPPFTWDEPVRQHARARLDALFFLLYGVERDDADYVLSTFPIVREQDERAFKHYATRDLILGYMAAFAAGDTESRIALAGPASSRRPDRIVVP